MSYFKLLSEDSIVHTDTSYPRQEKISTFMFPFLFVKDFLSRFPMYWNIANKVFQSPVEIYALTRDYVSFKKSLKTPHYFKKPYSQDEITAIMLKNRIRNSEEQKYYQDLLAKLAEQDFLFNTVRYLQDIDSTYGLYRFTGESSYLDKQISSYVEKNYHKLEVWQRKMLKELILSRKLVERLDNSLERLDKRYHLSVLIPVFHEQNRLKAKSEDFSGEDFLNIKLKQLAGLFSNAKNIDWSIVFVSDEPPSDSQTIKAMKENLNKLKISADLKNKVIFLDHQDFYHLVDSDHPDQYLETFFKESVKGGAVQFALKYLYSDKSPVSPDFLLMSDSDLSFDLGLTGKLLFEIAVDEDPNSRYYEVIPQEYLDRVVIGSRNLPGSYVVGKTESRQMLSSGFNFLIRTLFTLNIKDTQVGAKLYSSALLKKIAPSLTEKSMSYDVEILKRAAMNSALIKESPIVWVDSSMESHSKDQIFSMFMGLLSIYFNIYQKDISKQTDLQKVAEALFNEPQFPKVRELALNSRWTYIVENLRSLIEVLSVDELKKFLEAFKQVFNQLALGKIDEDELTLMLETFNSLVEELRKSHILQFLKKQFPQFSDVLELLHKNHSYHQVLLPLLFGTSVEIPIVYDDTYYSLSQYQKKLNTDLTKAELLAAWKTDFLSYRGVLINNDHKRTVPEPDHINRDQYVEPIRDKQRIINEIARLKQFDSELGNSKKQIKIGIAMIYNMDQTDGDYVEKVLGEKFKFINEELADLKNIKWHFEIVDARPERKLGIDHFIDYVILQNQSEVVSAHQLHLPTSEIKGFNKGYIMRQGLNRLQQEGYDYLGYIDFSTKIDFAFITSLLNNGYDYQKNQAKISSSVFEDIPVVSIASRYMSDSVVKNKPLAFVLRSMGMSMLIKMLFPKLFSVTDTQAGFKLFSANAWKQIADRGLQSDNLAFDVEILQQAWKLDIGIEQTAVNFYDKKYEQAQHFGVAQVSSVFKDLIAIRSRLTDTLYEYADHNEPTTIVNGGAEHLVCKWRDLVFKIPYESIDTNYFLFMRNLVLQNRKPMSFEQQEKRLTASPWYKKIIESKIGEYIPLLRQWVGFNVFVMKTISLLENKQYKSVGYDVAHKYGKDLIVPYEVIKQRFTISINGKPFTFDEHDRIKVSPYVSRTGIKVLQDILQSDRKSNEKIKQIKEYMSEVIALFYHLWRRGLFDLDTNILYDLGYYSDSQGQQKLMVIDPGEMISNKELLNIQSIRAQILERDDLMEIQKMINSSDIQQELKTNIYNYIKKEFNLLFDFIENDLKNMSGERLFASDAAEKDDFQIDRLEIDLPEEMDKRSALEQYNSRKSQTEAILKASINYQSRYLEKNNKDQINTEEINYSFHHLLPPQHNSFASAKKETSQEIPSGSIKPIMRYLAERKVEIKDLNDISRYQSKQIWEHLKELHYIDFLGEVEEKFKKIKSPEKMTDLSSKGYNYSEIVAIYDVLARAVHDPHSIINDSRHRAVIMPDAGYGIRTGLLGLSAGSKGLIKMEGQEIYKDALRHLKPVTDILDWHKYVILCSSDDIVMHNSQSVENIKRYFELPNSPGYYFFDLPDAGEDLIPISSEEIVRYITSTDTGKIVEDLLSEIPFFEGAVQHEMFKKLQGSVKTIAEHYLNSLAEDKRVEMDVSNNRGSALLDFMPKELIKHFLIYKATLLKGGAKTPFFFIFTRDFLKVFNEEVVPLIPDSLSRYLTWKMLLIDGMKADLFSWEMMRNELFISREDWLEIYRVIHQLKERFNISFEDSQQKELRVFNGHWRNFDDAVQVFRHIRKNFEIKQEALKNEQQRSRLAELPITFYASKKEVVDPTYWQTNSEYPIHVVLVEAERLKGNIQILTPEEIKKNYPFVDTTEMIKSIRNNMNSQILFYNVELEENKTLQVFPFHLVATIEYDPGTNNPKRRPFMMPYGLMTKEQIRNAPVYSFNSKGIPSPADNQLFKDFYRDIIERRFSNFKKQH